MIKYTCIYKLYSSNFDTMTWYHFSITKRDAEFFMTDVIVNIGGDSFDEDNLIAKFGKSENISMCKQVTRFWNIWKWCRNIFYV